MSGGTGPARRRYLLGVDLGTGGPKVALVSAGGELVGYESERTGTILLPSGGREQDPDAWWRAITAATRRLVGRGLVPVEDIAAICMSSQWGGLVPVDARGAHLHNAVIWMDSRGAGYSRALTGGGIEVPGTGYNARRLRTWLRKSGGVPSQSGKDPVGQAQWLRHQRPDVYAAADKLLDVPEYLTMRLSGRAVAAQDTVTLRWCTDNRDPSRIRYDDKLVRLCGLDPAKLPELCRPATVIGRILPAAARELGLADTVRVVAGTGDTTAAAIGAGAVLDYQAHLYVGTSAWLTCHVPFKKTDVLRNIASLPAVVPDRYWVATVQDVAGRAVDWLINEIVYPDDALSHGGPVPEDALDRLNALAAKAPPGSHGVIFTPWLNGERTPVEDRYLRGGWFNVSLGTDRADLARSVFEGIALNARWMKDAVERFVRRGLPGGFPALNFVGGGATSPLWCQTVADVLGCTVHQVHDPVLANARGAALIAAVALTELTWQDIPGRVRIAQTYQPDPQTRRLYDEQYRTFVGLYRSNRALYARYNGSGLF
jgi:xylulokinase